MVNGAEYRNQLNDQAYQKLANSYLCKSIIDRELKNYAGATWALIYAAWVCDDDASTDEAVVCRYKAADMLMTAEDHGEQVAAQSGASTALLVDLLRRSGRTNDARKAIAERRSDITEDIIIRILDFQLVLLEKGDTSCHRVSDVFGGDNEDECYVAASD